MNRQEHLLTMIAEEGVEVAQRATKALRFGLNEVQPGQEQNNAERMLGEYVDLLTVIYMLADNDLVFKDYLGQLNFYKLMAAKRAKVEHFLKYSAEQGRLEG